VQQTKVAAVPSAHKRAFNLLGCLPAAQAFRAESAVCLGRCFTYCKGGTMAPTFIKNFGLILLVCAVMVFHSGPVGMRISWLYISGDL